MKDLGLKDWRLQHPKKKKKRNEMNDPPNNHKCFCKMKRKDFKFVFLLKKKNKNRREAECVRNKFHIETQPKSQLCTRWSVTVCV